MIKKQTNKTNARRGMRRERIRTLRKPDATPTGKNIKANHRRRRTSSGPYKKTSTHKNTNVRKKRVRTSGKMRPHKKQMVHHVGGKKKPARKIPEPGENLRVIPLGGVEEIGKNMTAIEYKDDIIIIDAGFQFSEVETPGIDHIIPDVTYLEERKKKIRGLFITHGHMDHIGAIPYIMEKIGNPPIYSREFGSLVIKKRQAEFPTGPTLDIKTVTGKERIKAGKYFTVRFFEIEHAIRDSMGIIVETPVGNVALITDVRVNHKDGIPTKKEVDHYKFFKNEKVLLFMLDSTSVEKPGFSTPEAEAIEGVGEYIRNVSGRLIIGAFSSQVERLMKFIQIADSVGKKVVIDGRSMKGYTAILKQLKLLKSQNIITIEEMKDHPPHKIVIIATGAQGEEYSAFDRMANKTHKYITLNKTDTVVLSSSIIPGNEMAIQKLKDGLYRTDANIVTYLGAKVHASGHGSRGELEWIHKQINYKFFMPMHGHHYMLRIHSEMAISLGAPKNNVIVPDNGSLVEITPDAKKIYKLKEKAQTDPIMVDGFSVGGMQEVVVRDRRLLAEDGIVVIVASLDPRTGKLRKSPDIIARGFVYVRESQQLLNETRAIIKRTIENEAKGMRPINFDHLKALVTDEIRKHLFQKTAKSPMVIPVIIGV